VRHEIQGWDPNKLSKINTVPDLQGVADANASNQNYKRNGIPAHSAPIDDPAAFEAIKKLDQAKKIFVGKPN
jgi:hypothetical protein